MCFTVQLSRFLLTVICDSSFTLSHFLMCVKYFFEVFYFFKIQNLKRRRRDLNPRAAINDLLPFQGSPFGQLGYFSKLPYTIVFRFVLPEAFYIISCRFLFVKNFFNFFCNFFILNKRREWASNPRALADKRFSRPPRYDHFDISPYIIIK